MKTHRILAVILATALALALVLAVFKKSRQAAPDGSSPLRLVSIAANFEVAPDGRIQAAGYVATFDDGRRVAWDGLAGNRFVILDAGRASYAQATDFLRCIANQELLEAGRVAVQP